MLRIRTLMVSVAAAALLGGCMPEMDLQGHDPVEYYADHPIKATIELKNHPVYVHFAPGANRLSPPQIEALRAGLHGISMDAVESMQISFAPAEAHNEARKKHLTRMLRNMGYSKGNYMFEPLKELKAGEAQIDVTYASVVLPDCPDWKRSPVTTYSNTSQGNFRCASETNLGLMVADPHDLVRGSSDGRTFIDTPRATKALEDYRGSAGGGYANSPQTSAGGYAPAPASSGGGESGTGGQ